MEACATRVSNVGSRRMVCANSKSGLVSEAASGHCLRHFTNPIAGEAPILSDFSGAAILHRANVYTQTSPVQRLTNTVEKIYSSELQGPDSCTTTSRRQWELWL
jgi:hypothetical protein